MRAAPALELTLAALGTLVDGARAAALAQRVGTRAAPPLRDALRLRRLAAAVGEVERARDERAYAELCGLLQDGAAATLRPADAMLLRVYLGVSTEPLAMRARALCARCATRCSAQREAAHDRHERHERRRRGRADP